MSSILVSLLGSAHPLKKPGPSNDFEKVKGGRGGGLLPKRDTNLELILWIICQLPPSDFGPTYGPLSGG